MPSASWARSARELVRNLLRPRSVQRVARNKKGDKACEATSRSEPPHDRVSDFHCATDAALQFAACLGDPRVASACPRVAAADFQPVAQRHGPPRRRLCVTAIEDLNRWLEAPREHERLEFKEAKTQYDTTKLFRYCVALANEGGGHLVLGVTDRTPRRVVGSQAFLNRGEIQ